MKLRSAEPRWLGRMALLAVAAAAVMLLAACSSEPGTGSTGAGSTGAGSTSAAVQLNPPSGPESSSPTWSTTKACASGFQGSGIFRMLLPSGRQLSLSAATNSVTTPFHGTLLDPINIIQAYTNIPNGHTVELAIICFSGDSLTGTPDQAMDTFITFSADGKTYTTSSTAPAGFSPAPTGS